MDQHETRFISEVINGLQIVPLMICLFFDDRIAPMRKLTSWKILLVGLGLVLLALVIYQLPPVQRRFAWRVDFALVYLHNILDPVGNMPTPLPRPRVMITRQPTETPFAIALAVDTITPTPIPAVTPTPAPSPTPIPQTVALTPPKWEKQAPNNCGPTSLAMYLRYYGWDGDQTTIDSLVKPKEADRNVNVEELEYFVRNKVGWLNFEYRVGGDTEILKKFLAAGIPIMIEEGFILDQSYWPNDDHWAAHYELLTGYDDALKVFTGQDSFLGPDRKLPYDKLDELWQAFNRVYIVVYPPDKEEVVKSIMGLHWDKDFNRKNALLVAEEETRKDPKNPYPWFNLGTNLVYFDRYLEAADAYDKAREIGLPQRFLRYQFGPFLAYFHSGQTENLLSLVDYALQRTKNSEEALLWRGWAYYRQGKQAEAIADFQQALQENPNYQDAQYALNFVYGNP
jgi:tetratricopeptide (TPR) repeat protein